jgi:hypothetical protein
VGNTVHFGKIVKESSKVLRFDDGAVIALFCGDDAAGVDDADGILESMSSN